MKFAVFTSMNARERPSSCDRKKPCTSTINPQHWSGTIRFAIVRRLPASGVAGHDSGAVGRAPRGLA